MRVVKVRQVQGRVHQLGLSIVELMVSILIGLIVLAGVLQVMLSSKTTFLGQEEMSYIQENARFALDIIGRDVQSAGYWGCAGVDATIALVASAPGAAGDVQGAAPLAGFDGDEAASWPAWLTSSVDEVNAESGAFRPDVLVVRRLEGIPQPLQSHSANQLVVRDGSQFASDGYVGVVDESCRSVGVIRTASVTGNTITYNAGQNCGRPVKTAVGNTVICGGGSDGCACSGTTSHGGDYFPGASVHKYSANAYYVAESGSVTGQPALKRAVLKNGATFEEELALGVEDFDVLYGEDITDDGLVDVYVSADNVEAWRNVHVVQIGMVFRSQAASMPEAESVTVLGKTYNDRFMRQTVTATYRLRNRI